MGNINQGYFDRVRYILQHKILGSEIIAAPLGWNSDNKELARNKDYNGIFPSFSNSLKFNGGSYDYLKSIYDIYGVNEDVRLIREEKHPKTDMWTRTYEGYLDFMTYIDEDSTISIKFNSGGLEAILKSRESELVEVNRTTSLDGKAISELNTVNVEIDSRRIFLQSKWESDVVNNVVSLAVFSDDGNTRNQSVGFPLNLINQSHEEAHSVIPQSEANKDNGTTGMMFLATFDRDRELNIKGTNISFLPIINESDWQWAYFKLSLVIYGNGVDYNVKERITLFHANTTTGPGVDASLYDFQRKEFGQFINIGQSYTINFNETVNVEAGDSIALEFLIEADLENFAVNRARYYVDVTQISGVVNCDEDSFFNKTISKSILSHELAERILEIYTGEKVLKSNVLGRTDIGYSEDGKASFIANTHGFWVRGFDELPISTENEINPFKPLTTSLKDFLSSYSAMYNLGLGIDRIGFKEHVVIEDLSYFYNLNTTIKLPNRVNKVKRSPAKEYFYSSLEFGYEKAAEYEEAFGLIEYNGISKFTTVFNRLKNVYSKISKYRADSYGIEFARRKQKLTHNTTDTKYDADIFVLHVKRGFNNLLNLRKWQDDLQEIPTGTFSPETAYNLLLSPFNCLLRHGWILAAGLTKNISDFIRYSSSTANSQLKTKVKVELGGNGNEYLENGDIVASELKRARYTSEFVEFEHQINFEINQMINGFTTIQGKKIPNIYGLIEYENENGDIEKGFLESLKLNEGKFKVLKFNK